MNQKMNVVRTVGSSTKANVNWWQIPSHFYTLMWGEVERRMNAKFGRFSSVFAFSKYINENEMKK